MSRRLFLFSLLVSAGVGLTQFQGCSVSPPGGVCPVNFIDTGYISSLSIGVVGPAVVRGYQVLSRTEFRVTASGVSGPQPDPSNARLVLYGANFNGASCAVTVSGRWLPHTKFSASTKTCATPSGGLYTGEIILIAPIAGFSVESAF